MSSPSSRNSSPTPLAASYARKSTADDMGIAAQHMTNVQKAARDGYTIPDDPAFRFGDDDTSGRRTSRDDLDRVMALIKGGKAPFSRLYIKDKTREGRFSDPRFHFFLQVLFEEHGVKICYGDRDVQLDFSDGDPRDMFALLIRDLIESISGTEELSRLIAPEAHESPTELAPSAWSSGTVGFVGRRSSATPPRGVG